MRIELANLEEGRGDFAQIFQPGALDLGDERTRISGPVTVTGKLRLRGAELVITGHLDGRVAVECDRCLKHVESSMNADFTCEYISGQMYESNNVAELTEEEMTVSVFDGEAIDVDEIVKEQILLSVPTRTLCRQDCKGICPVCGNDKNERDCNCETTEGDPRWAALRELRNGKE